MPTAPEIAKSVDAKEDNQPLTLDLSKLSKIRGGVKLRRDLKVILNPSYTHVRAFIQQPDVYGCCCLRIVAPYFRGCRRSSSLRPS
jgi:hypothetical protein